MVDPNKIIETVAGGNINVIIQKLASLTIDHVSPLWENSREIEKLKEELQIIHAVLVDMSNEENPSQQEKLWKNKMRELAYDIEDAINSFTQASNNRAQEAQDPNYITRIKNTIQRCTEEIKSLPSCLETANKIKDLKQSLSSMEQRSKRQKTGGNGDGSSHDSIPIRDFAQYAAPADLVGIEGHCNHIVHFLTEEVAGSSTRPRKVVAIVGFGGLGKTTLAKQVFDNIKGRFDLKAFVTVSQNPDIKTVLLNILRSFGLGRHKLHDLQQSGVDVAHIIDKLREYIAAKRYLVVLDDIWKEDVWTSLNATLFDNNCDSNIIVTTRKDEVATASCSSNRSHVYRMEPLNHEDSKILFLNKTFGGSECPPNLERVCHGILKKCARSPLAILVLSGMLTNKKTVSQWEHVLNTIGSEDSKYNVVRRIISLSYFDLPQHLRTCLMYLSIFPEDFVISRKRLANRWIAEGFISSEDGASITETAEGYFGELISRNLIQAVDIKYDGEARACRVHDTILDFIKYKAHEENFVSINCRQLGGSGNKVRRLSVQSYQDAQGRAAQDLSDYVRSVTFFGYSPWTVSLRGFPNLRVLDAKDGSPYQNDGVGGRFVDFDVATLPHLRYLDLSSFIDFLSSGVVLTQRVLTRVANLQFLETLDLTDTLVKELPTDVYKLQRLVRLFIDSQVRLPDGIGQMKALEELECVGIYRDSSPQFLQELGHLTKLGSISIMIEIEDYDISSDQECILVSSLVKLREHNLHSLKIYLYNDFYQYGNYRWPVYAGISLEAALQGLRMFKMKGGHFTKVPDWMATLNGLEKLKLEVKKMDQDDLDILGELKSLLYLWFIGYSPKKRLTFRANKGFRSLKYLRTGGMPKRGVTPLTFQDGSVPRLEQLRLTIHTGSRILPGSYVSGIEYLDSLTKVNVLLFYMGKKGVLTAYKNAITDAVNMLPNKPTLTIDSCAYYIFKRGSENDSESDSDSASDIDIDEE